MQCRHAECLKHDLCKQLPVLGWGQRLLTEDEGVGLRVHAQVAGVGGVQYGIDNILQTTRLLGPHKNFRNMTEGFTNKRETWGGFLKGREISQDLQCDSRRVQCVDINTLMPSDSSVSWPAWQGGQLLGQENSGLPDKCRV